MDEPLQDHSILEPNGQEASSAMTTGLGFWIGQRINAVGNPRRVGTVRYVGEVEGYAGDWVGVDWDDGEGKHDGSVGDVRYFLARGERSGSFVRAKNLSSGISFLEALHLRYGSESTKEEEEEMYVYSTSQKHVSIQLVGKHKIQEKLQHINELLNASLSYLGVSSTEPSNEINAVVPNLKELDLTGNLLSRWQDIDTLCKALPALEILNLTNNLMDCKIPYIPSLGGIRVLVLSNCGITWNQVEELKESLSAIQELHLMKNNIQIIVCASNARGQGFDSLRVLNLEENHIESWDEILKLSYLRSLEQLHLNRNKLRQIYYPLDQRMTGSDFSTKATNIRPFECLQCLLLGSNEIDNAASIDSLNLFPRLMDIRLSDNPIVDPSKGGVSRFVLVARLAKVKFLNGSEVSQRERKESEIRYVRLVMSKMQSDDLEEIQRFHPRFVELKALHGIADETPSSGISGPQKMSSGLICVTLKCVGASMGEKQPLTKKLPSTVTVGKLKALCESFFKLKGIRLKLFIQEQEAPLPSLLDDDMIPLGDVGVSKETTILVDEES
ncbi:tubulin-folding cofactor E-like isoform X1 [Zingiber officinale]|uniref:tubulin-folding cofactor E-like isoform X1 n=1 Tax=Zingiber officinale TaxID=94328 RepID=UPI001C4DB699|nr:tubulin-folding cofactor E-like isoform X1 [Zingiber officinale]